MFAAKIDGALSVSLIESTELWTWVSDNGYCFAAFIEKKTTRDEEKL